MKPAPKKKLKREEFGNYARDLTIRTMSFIRDDIKQYKLTVDEREAIATTVLIAIATSVERYLENELETNLGDIRKRFTKDNTTRSVS